MAMKEYDFDKEPTVAIVKKILIDSIKMKATDIHFDPRKNDLVVRFRINGDLDDYTIVPDNSKVNVTTRVKILAGMNITESNFPQIGAINFENNNNNYNMRVSTLPVADGEKVVVHLSNYATNIKGVSALGFKDEDVKKIMDMIRDKNGIILVTGTTGSGKSTTLYAMLREINNKADNIISIEDPIKMKIEGINQVEVNPDKGLSLKTVLRNVLLQDPNVVSICELYDDETTRSAIRIAVTGKLVLSTMQTKSVYQTIDTLLNMDVENYLLGSYLTGIISQRLVKRLCPSCKEKRKASKYEKSIIKRILDVDIDELYYPKGCEDCQNGYLKQIPVSEVVKVDDELRYAISNNKNRDLIKRIVYASNSSILKNGLDKVVNGETSFEEVMRITDIKVDLDEDDKDIKEIILGNIPEDEIDSNDESKEVKKVRLNIKKSDENVKEEDTKVDETKVEVSKDDKEEEKENIDSQDNNSDDSENSVNSILATIEQADAKLKENVNVGDEKNVEDEDLVAEEKDDEEENVEPIHLLPTNDEDDDDENEDTSISGENNNIEDDFDYGDDDDTDDFNYDDNYINNF